MRKRVKGPLVYKADSYHPAHPMLRGTSPCTLRNWGVDHTDLQFGG